MDTNKIYFAGDHNAGLHPKVLERISQANIGKAASYGGDEETLKMRQDFNHLFGKEVRTYVFNSGTAANICAIASITKPYNSIICAKSGHINTYEAGGPTRFSGCVVEALPTTNGKFSVDQLKTLLIKRPAEFDFSQPKVVYITQPTDLGVLWTKKELKELADFCHHNNLLFFMDGARIANAVSAMNVDIKSITTDVGVDLLTWGGIKNGGLADVLIYLNSEIALDVDFIYKQLGQMVAKSRFYAASVNGLLENNIWLDNASHAVSMTNRLYQGIKDNPKIKFVAPVETNFIWSVIPDELEKSLNQKFVYYLESNDLSSDEYKDIPFFTRWLTSWATTEEEVDLFIQAINQTL